MPRETAFGRKRAIDQSVCNKDFSCVEGFCPSFIELDHPELNKPNAERIRDREADIFASLPGAACLTQARLIVALGTDRDRYQNARSLQACSGIAPVTKQSGKSRQVDHRWACTKFMKQTFHEFAGLSIGYSTNMICIYFDSDHRKLCLVDI